MASDGIRCPECGGVAPRLFDGQDCPHCGAAVAGRTRDPSQPAIWAFGRDTEGVRD